MTQAVTTSCGYDIYVGIDVDKKSYALTAINQDTYKQSCKLPSEPEQLVKTIQNKYAGKRVLCVYEAGPTGYHLYDYLNGHNQKCVMVSPSSIPIAPNHRVKTNRVDSERLAVELRGGNLKPIRVPEGAYRDLRHLVNCRAIYAHNRGVAKQRIKALLLYANLFSGMPCAEENWSCRHIEALKNIPCTLAVRYRLDMLLTDLEYARNQTLSILKQLKLFCVQHPEIDRNRGYLQSIPGIGFITATSVLGYMGDPRYLRKQRELGAFLGLVPCEHSTGDTVNRGSITHLGNRTVRILLIEAAWSAIRQDAELNQFFHRIKKRNNSKIAAQKAIVAVARKLTDRIYCVLKGQRNYQIR